MVGENAEMSHCRQALVSICVWVVMCIDMAGFVGQITVTGSCCLNGDEMIVHTFDASGIGK